MIIVVLPLIGLMGQLGQWVQTLYIGSTKEDASEVTLTTGTSVTGFITTLTFEEIVGNRSNLLTADKTSIVNAINEHDKLLRNSNADALNTTSKNIVGAINELESKHYLDVFDLQGGSVLDYAKTFEALTHNYFYANNCSDLPNSMNYGYCSVDVSQDPLYRDITFYCPTTGRIYVNTIGANEDLTGFGEWSGWHEFLMKKDIVTTLDSTVTNEQVPSAKAVFNSIDNIQDTLTTLTAVTDLDNFKASSFMIGRGTGYNNETTNIPNGVNGAFVVEWFPYGNGDLYGVQKITLVQPINNEYVTFERSLDNNNWMGWKRLCTTSVADVGKTSISLIDSTNYTIDSNLAYSYYEIINGICYVEMIIKCISPVNGNSSAPGHLSLPIPRNALHVSLPGAINTNDNIILFLGINAQFFKFGTADSTYIAHFSYPVSES